VSSFAQILEETLLEEPADEGPPPPASRSALDAFEYAVANAPDRVSANGQNTSHASTERWAIELGVERPCSLKDITRAFRRLAFRTHPDRPGGSHESFLHAKAVFAEALAALHAQDTNSTQAARAMPFARCPAGRTARSRGPVRGTLGSVYA
jgi:hypothetical protein